MPCTVARVGTVASDKAGDLVENLSSILDNHVLSFFFFFFFFAARPLRIFQDLTS